MRPDRFSLAKAWINDERSTPEEAKATWETMSKEFDENRKAMLMASAESDKIKAMMNKKFGSGTMKYGSEIPQPAQRDDVIQIDAINAFMKRNPAAEGGRMGFKKGLSVPQYPDLRQFGAYESPAKTKLLNDFKKKLKKYLLQEIKDFKKTALPKEKYQLVKDNIYRAMGYNPNEGKKPSKTLIKYVKETIDTLPKDNTWELNTTGKGQLASSVDRSNPIPENIKNRTKDFFRKNYKNLNISQMAERLTNTISGHPLHAAVKENLNRYKNFLIEKNVIKDADLSKGVGGAEGVKKLPPKAYADYRKEYTDLAKKAGIADDPQFFATKGKSKGKFGYWKFDDYMKNTMLNMDKIRATLSPDFPTMLLPSFEHTMGVKPGLITGDTSALKKVELQTKKYNFGAIDGMGARSADFRRVQANLKSATKELKAGNLDAANTSLAKVNEIYDNVAEKFNINRKGLPNYNVDGKNIFESNIKEVSKAEKPNKSMFNFFEKVANQASKKEMKIIKKSDPKVFDVLTEFQGEGDSKKIREMIKVIGCPNFKAAGGGRAEFSTGADCFDKGQKLINNGMKGASPASMRNAAKFLNSAYKFGRNVMKFGIVPEAIFVAGETLLRSLGDQTLEEGLKSSIGFYTDWTGLTDFKSDARISQNMRNMGVDATMNIERLVDFNDATEKVNKLKESQKQNLAVWDKDLMGSEEDYKKQSDENIKAAELNLDNKFLKESEKLYFSQQQDEAADIAGARSPFQKAYAAAKNKTENLRSDGSIIDLNDLSGMQSDMFMTDPMSKKAKKDSVSSLPPQSPLTGSKGEQEFLKLSQLPMAPRMGSEIDVLAKAMNENFKAQNSDQRTDAAYLKALQDYKNNYKNMTMEEMLAIGIPREAIYGFNQPEVIKEKPVYDFSEGGITGLRSKYEYKK